MKKIISLFILLFAFSLSTKAQETSKDNVQVLVENDIKALSEYLKIDTETSTELYNVLLFKHKSLAEEKGEEAQIILERKTTSKLESVLGKEQFLKLSKNKALLKKMTLK